jgi:hypothetical protein
MSQVSAVSHGSLKRKSRNEVQPRIIPAFHRALLAQIPNENDKTWSLLTAYPVPTLGPGQVLIKTSHVGLNPYDWQGVAFRFAIGPEAKVMGRDGAGIVVATGSDVARFEIGDRVRCFRAIADHRSGFLQTPPSRAPARFKSILSTLLPKLAVHHRVSVRLKLQRSVQG